MVDRERLRKDATYRQKVFESLFDRYHLDIVRYCATRVGDLLAEDVAQAVFRVVWTKLGTFEPNRPIGHWLYAIAKRECQRTFRNASKRQILTYTFRKDIQEAAHSSRSPSPDMSLEYRTQNDQLIDGLAQLRQEDMIILNMRYRRELSVAEIAEIIGTSQKTAHKRLERARRRLREIITNDAQG